MLDEVLTALGLTDEDAAELLEVVSWVDQEVAHETYGYRKDNAIPASLKERMESKGYVKRLAQAAEELDVEARVVQALLNWP